MGNCSDNKNPCCINFEIVEENATLEIDANYIISGEGTKNYNKLENKPQINSVTLIGDKTSEELRLQGKMNALTPQEIEKILYLD